MAVNETISVPVRMPGAVLRHYRVPMSWPRRLSLATASLTAVPCCAVTAAASDVSAGLVFALVSAVLAGAFATGLGLFVSRRRPANLVEILLTFSGLVPPVQTLLDPTSR